jgi:hypothetical protein
MVPRSVFERLEASGFRELKVHLTEEARAHAFAAAVPALFTYASTWLEQSGREGQTESTWMSRWCPCANCAAVRATAGPPMRAREWSP